MNRFIHINTRYGVNKISVFSVLLSAALVGGLFVANYMTRAAGPWYVTTTGNDADDCLSVGTACLTIQAAVTKASSGDTINIAAGTYDVGATTIALDKSLTILGPNDLISPTDGSRVAEAIIEGHATLATFRILPGATDVVFRGLKFQTLGAEMRSDNKGSTITLEKNIFTGSRDDGMWFDDPNLTVDDNLFTGYHTSASETMAMDVSGAPTVVTISITNNTWSDITGNGALNLGRVHGTVSNNQFNDVEYYGMLVAYEADLTISNNVFDSITNPTVSPTGNELTWGAGVRFYVASSATVASITGNTFSNSYLGVSVRATDSDITSADISVNDNSFSGNDAGILNAALGTLDATQNWWGDTTGPTHASNPDGSGDVVSDNVNFDPWYTNLEMTTLSDGVATDATYTSTTVGQADLPAGVTEVILTNDTVLDVSDGVNTESGGNIIVEGTSQDLGNYTNGALSGEDLDAAQDVGGTSVTIGTAVNLQSGTNGDPIVLTNSDLANVSVSIPDDTTVLAPAGWDGTIEPPQTGSSSGTAPSGFSIGSTVIEVGSPDFVLLFDRPVTITLTGVTGAVGYKPAGSSVWTQITDTCGGDYANPTLSAADFPGECKVTNGTDTKILTYHLTTFGSLNTVGTDGGGGGGGYYTPPSTTPTPIITRGDSANLAVYGLKEGDTISARDSNDPDVYIVNEHGYKRLFLNPIIFNFYGHLGFSKVRSIVPVGRDAFPASGLFRNCETNDPKVYGVEVTGEDTGILHWVNTTGAQAVADDPDFLKKVFCINNNEFNWYPKGTAYTSVSQIPEYRRQTFAPAPVLHSVKVVSTTPYLNVRNAPSLTGTIIGQLKPGEVVNYTQISNGWWYQIIQSNGVSGWVSAKYVTVVQ